MVQMVYSQVMASHEGNHAQHGQTQQTEKEEFSHINFLR
jgi:hypothetical protein